MPVLMSIRTIHSDRIFGGVKRIEFRKRFPTDYKGTIVVYECGEGSLHKVVGQFKTDRPVRYDPKVGITKELKECLERTDYTTFDVECLKAYDYPIVCIPVIEPKRIDVVTLEEFSAKYQTTPHFNRPPQSWQYFRCGASKENKNERPKNGCNQR